ncbi:hypothetical protein [Bacillus velezensis]|uniref:hypothetical protein n=1 Tax=Bacillus velezensis TaxID=492670 RepID=UPI00042E40E8|nr:hypothetical protein [Bacillus velezensis]AHK47790.1 hypothetical protein AJ82_00965 [Bacillus velezensis TrigoCor1448]MCG0590609.1 hypothetical protein [Bacillus velezensis]
MFKRLGTLLLIASLVLLTACKNSEESSSSSSGNKSSVPDNSSSESQDISENGPNEVGDVYEIDGGTAKVTAISNKETTAKSGPIQLTVKRVIAAVANEKTPFIELELEAKNTSDGVVNFTPDSMKLATSTGVQVEEPSLDESDDLLGEYIGKVKDSGSVFYIFQNEEDIENLDSIRLRVASPSDENATALGDKMDIKINLEH